MKRLVPLLLLTLLVSCSDRFSTTDLLKAFDKSLPQVTHHELVGNTTFQITFSETVEVLEVLVGGVPLSTSSLGQSFTFPLPHPLEAGEEKTFSMTVRKTNGNTARCSFLLRGINERIPKMILNEVSVKGTASAPDRVELLVMSKGNTLGMILHDGEEGKGVVFPSLEVKTNDLIVIYWNSRTAKTREDKEEGFSVFYLNGNVDHTLSGTSGVLVLEDRVEGETMDAILYTNDTTVSYGGYGSKQLEERAKSLLEQGSWSGEPLDSTLVTSSRVFVRLPGGIDSDSADDWFICAPRTSTFGERNNYHPYEED